MNDNDILRRLLKTIEEDESGISLLNADRINEFKESLLIINELFGNQKSIKIEYKLHYPYPSMAYIHIIGSDIRTEQPDKFKHALALASNLLITPLLKGKIQIELTFHGITTNISEE